MRIGTILLTIVIIVVGVVLLQTLNSFATEAPVAEKREPVVAVAVQIARITSHRPVISVIGTIEAKDEASMTSPLETEVRTVPVEVGDHVTAGQILVELDLRETGFQLEMQLATLDEIEAQLTSLQRDAVTEHRRRREIQRLERLAREELTRNQSLFDSGLISQTVVDQATAAMSARALELLGQQQRLDSLDLSQQRLVASQRRTRAQAGQLQVLLERGKVKAPFAGIVKAVHTAAGTRIGRGAPLVELYDPTSVRLRAAIPNEHATTAALEGILRTTNGNQPLQLQSIAPEAKVGRGTVDALFRLAPGTWLLGTAVEFDLLLPAVKDSVALPFDALYNGNRVYVADQDSRATAIDCSSSGQTYVNNQLRALLLCPKLQPTDQVVVNRVPNLVGGTKISIVES